MNKIFLHFITVFSLLVSSLLVSQMSSTTQVFNYTGSDQVFTVPPGVTSITIEAWGAGGAGAGGTTNAVRGGGGGGAYTKFPISVIPGNTYTIIVGTGGNGSGNPGSSGTPSTVAVGASTIVSAAGGAGGNNTTGGAGAAATNGFPISGAGLVRNSGGNGADGASNNGGGGGGSAGTGGSGGNAIARNGGSAGAGTGGSAGGDGGERTGFFSPTAGSGINGVVAGSGGGGRSSGGGTATGGNGGNGRVIITYSINPTNLSITKTVANAFVDDVATFTLIAKNNKATIPAYDVVLTDLLPSGYTFISADQSGYNNTTGVWNIGTMAANATATLKINALVKSTGVHDNTATVASNSMPDDTPANNTITLIIPICKASGTAPQIKSIP